MESIVWIWMVTIEDTTRGILIRWVGYSFIRISFCRFVCLLLQVFI